MSTSTKMINGLLKVASSQSFKNFSTFYLQYLKIAGGVGAAVGTAISVGHLADCSKQHKKQMRKIKASGGDPDDIDEISYLYSTCVLTAGPLVGASAGVMWPVTIVVGPLYYAFGDYLGPIVQGLLTLSLLVVKDDIQSDTDKNSK